MNGYVLPGVIGLLLGLTLRWTQLCRPAALQAALALRVSHSLRSLLYFLGAGMALTALLMWLAVIDVDGVVVLPFSPGVLLGGAVFGAAIALTGYTPLTAFAGAGSGTPVYALCTIAGCLTGTLLLPLLDAPFIALQSLPPHSAATLFRTTLDEPYLLGGGFLAQGCAGALLMAIAMCIPSNRRSGQAEPAPVNPASPDAEAADAAAVAVEPDMVSALPLLLPAPVAEAPAEEEPAPPETAPEDAFIALLPGEEALVVDTGLDDETDEDAEASGSLPEADADDTQID